MSHIDKLEEMKIKIQEFGLISQYSEATVLNALDLIQGLEQKEISDNRILVANLYYEILKNCQYGKLKTSDEITKKLLITFGNIELLVTEAEEVDKLENLNHGKLFIIKFLHDLKITSEEEMANKLKENWLEKWILPLLHDLNSIYFIFNLTGDNGQIVFPISNTIAIVVKNADFFHNENGINPFHVRLLQLAVKLFEDRQDHEKILRILINECNLKFITYLQNDVLPIDTTDMLNYSKNKVMIFFDKDQKKVLIRHNNKEYFKFYPNYNIQNYQQKDEKDYNNNVIGTYFEYNLDNADSLVNFSELMKDINNREKLLDLVFCKGFSNVLYENSIVQKTDGSFEPLNLFAYRDDFIIASNNTNKDFFKKEEISEALKPYWNTSLKINNTNIMNRVQFGLAVLLLQQERVNIDKLCLKSLDDEQWYQDQVIGKWLQNTSNPFRNAQFIINLWIKQNEYFKNRKPKKKELIGNDIQNKELDFLPIWPFYSDLSWIKKILGIPYTKENLLTYGICIKEEEQIFLQFNTNEAGTKQIAIDNKNDPEQIIQEEDATYFFVYNSTSDAITFFDQPLLKSLYGLQEILKTTNLTLHLLSHVDKYYYNDIESKMIMQSGGAFEQTGSKYFFDIRDQIYYRLIHILIWNKIKEDNIKDFLKIIKNHFPLEYKRIKEDNHFNLEEAKTLYIPKDNRESDSTLRQIYEDYIKKRDTREPHDLFNPKVEKREDGCFYFNKSKIENIVFLCDNIMTGSATTNMLKGYLNIEPQNEQERVDIENKKKKLTSIRLKDTDEVISINEILKVNRCTIGVHCYYGSDEGINKVNLYLQSLKNINTVATTRNQELKPYKTNIIHNHIKNIWNKEFNPDFFTVIREFNMPKQNVFPDEMLVDPKKAICMFVKKKEIQ